MLRRTFIASSAAASAAATLPAQAQAWPTKPVRVIVPYAPGGTTDVVGRVVCQHLSERLGQQFLVENRGGAGASIGTDLVGKAAPDGYTLLVSVISGFAISPFLYPSVTYDALRDFSHIAIVSINPSVLVVNPSFPAKTLKEYIDYARANPGKVSYATSGAGSSNHILGVMTEKVAGLKMEHVPYRGAGPAMQDVIANNVPSMFDSLPSASAHIRSGKVRALAVSGEERNSAFPEVPTMKEQGYPDLISNSWFGLSGPAKLPPAIIELVHRHTMEIMQLPSVVETWKKLGADYLRLDPAQVTDFIRKEVERYKPLVAASGAKPD